MDINSSEPSSSLAAPKSVNLYTKLKQNSFYFYTFQNTKLKHEFWIASNTPWEQWTGSKRIFSGSEIWPKYGAGLGIRKFLDGIRDLTATGEEGFAKILARDVVFENKMDEVMDDQVDFREKERECGIRIPPPDPDARVIFLNSLFSHRP